MSSSTRLHSNFIDPQFLTLPDLVQMWEIYAQYHNVTKERFFERTTTEFDYINVYSRRDNGAIVGFTGIKISEMELGKRQPLVAIYYGQVFVLPEFRGDREFRLSFIKTGLYFKLKFPLRRSYVWFDAITYKPYVLCSNYLKEFYPVIRKQTPGIVAELIQAVGQRFFGELFDTARGTISNGSRRVTDRETIIRQKDLKNARIRCYTKLNPGFQNGDGLICVYPNTILNYAYVIMRMLRKSWPESSRPLRSTAGFLAFFNSKNNLLDHLII